MKKKIAIICCLVLVMASLFTVFAACKGGSSLSDDDLKILRSTLYNTYREDAAEQTKNYKMAGEISGYDADGNDIKCGVVWKIEGTDKVTVSSEKDDKGYYTVNVPDQTTLEESISYTLIGTLVNDKGEAYKGYNGDENALYTVSFNRTISQLGGENTLLQHYLPAVISAPEMGKDYNLSMYHGGENYLYYFTGAMSGNYYATSDKLANSKKVKLEQAEGGFYISFDNNGTKNYLTLTDNSEGGRNPKAKVSFTTTASTVFSVDASKNGALKASISTTIDSGTLDSTFYLGGSTSYKTISASSDYYVIGNNAANVDVTQCVVRLVGDEDFNKYGGIEVDDNEIEKIRGQFEANPVEGTAYKLAVYKGSETLYFNGQVKSTYYLGVTTSKDQGVDCYIEKTDGGFYIYFNGSSGKTYVTIEVSGTHINAVMRSAPNGAFQMDETLRIPYMTLGSDKVYMDSAVGQLSISALKWANMNKDTLDVSSWAARLVAAN